MLGIRLALAGDGGLAIDAPRGALTPELLARLRAAKADILAALAPAAPCATCGCPIFAQHPDGRLACGLCHRRPEGARLLLVVHRPDGSTAWADCALEREAVAAGRTTGPEAPTPAPAKAKAVCRCGSTTWRDVAIHDGQSVRQDCARCGRFLRFTVWRGVVLE